MEQKRNCVNCHAKTAKFECKHCQTHVFCSDECAIDMEMEHYQKCPQIGESLSRQARDLLNQATKEEEQARRFEKQGLMAAAQEKRASARQKRATAQRLQGRGNRMAMKGFPSLMD